MTDSDWFFIATFAFLIAILAVFKTAGMITVGWFWVMSPAWVQIWFMLTFALFYRDDEND